MMTSIRAISDAVQYPGRAMADDNFLSQPLSTKRTFVSARSLLWDVMELTVKVWV